MKRSEINAYICEAADFFTAMGFYLPPVASWTPSDWVSKGEEIREIVDVGIGWDITDFGRGDFPLQGLVLFTTRNGLPGDKPYAEKIMMVREGQLTLTHFHHQKTEDIINRGGGDLLLTLHNAAEDGGLAITPVTVQMDGVTHVLPAGTTVTLRPGESITLTPRLYHSFWGKDGMVLVGEVSSVNDDYADNAFLEPQLRFPEIEEDEPPVRWLVSDYNKRFIVLAPDGGK
ncbi:MAG: D-lyxose/D-mannose family sugar isomerase [bacterium]